VVDLFVFSEETHDFAPVSRVFLLLNNFEAHELPGDARADLPCDGVSTDCHSFYDIIVLHELSALVLVVLLDGRNWLSDVWCITPVWAVTELRAPKFTCIIIIKHLLDNNLEVLLWNLVLRCFLAITPRCPAVLHVHNRMSFRLHLVSIPRNNTKKLILILFQVHQGLPLERIMLNSLGSINDEVGIGQKIHGMPSHCWILLNLRKHAHVRVHSCHSTHWRGHSRPHNHVWPLHQIWESLLFRLCWS
jgi:hypothetical protein